MIVVCSIQSDSRLSRIHLHRNSLDNILLMFRSCLSRQRCPDLSEGRTRRLIVLLDRCPSEYAFQPGVTAVSRLHWHARAHTHTHTLCYARPKACSSSARCSFTLSSSFDGYSGRSSCNDTQRTVGETRGVPGRRHQLHLSNLTTRSSSARLTRGNNTQS